MWTRGTPVLLAFLAACATSPLQLAAGEKIPDGEVLVLGHVEVYDGATQVIGAARSAPPTQDWDALDLVVAPEGGGDASPHRLTDGRIRWHLRPGKYAIWSFARSIRVGECTGAIRATFDVPPGASAVYLGTLRVRFGDGAGETHGALREPTLHPLAPARILVTPALLAHAREMPKLLAPFSLEVVDRLDEEVRAARSFVPRGAIVERTLLQLPTDVAAGDPALAPRGAVDDDGTIFRSVRPVRPERAMPTGPFQEWPQVELVEPMIEWEPLPGVDRAGLTYDLRISRVITNVGGVWTWGPIEYYRARLQETRHRVETPLSPSAYYYWEVRLRRGDVVGPWSGYDVAWLAPAPPDLAEPSIPNVRGAAKPVAASAIPRKRGAFGFRTPVQ